MLGAEGHRLFYRVAGGGPDTLVVVHGFQGNNQSYLAADLEPLIPGHALLFYDQRGGGRSDPVTSGDLPELEDHVADLEALRSALRFERLRLVGHSGGAYIAVQYALTYPARVDRIAMVAPGPPSPDYAAEITSAFASRLDAATWEHLNGLNASLPESDDPAAICEQISSIVLASVWLADSTALRRMNGSMCEAPPSALRSEAAIRQAFESSIAGRNWTPELTRLARPVVIVHGERDAIPVAAAEEWHAALPDSQLKVVEAADHLPWLDGPTAVSHALTTFFGQF